METGSVMPFESTHHGWTLTVELEAHQNDATGKLQEIMDIMMTVKRLEQTENTEHTRGLLHAINQILTGCVFFATFRMAEHRPVSPQERSLDTLTETDGDETMMDNSGEDAGETIAVTSKTQPMKPPDQESATHKACGHYPYRDWCRACVGVTGRSDAHKRRCEEQNSLHVASKDYGFFTDGDDGDHTRGATPFLLVKVKPSMITWCMPVQCKGVEEQAAIKETVESR